MRGGHQMAARDGAGERRRTRSSTSARGSSEGGPCAWRLCAAVRGVGTAERQSHFQVDTALARGVARSAARACEGEACRGPFTERADRPLSGELLGLDRPQARRLRCRSEAGSSDAPEARARRDGDQPAERRQGVRSTLRPTPRRSVAFFRRWASLDAQFAPA